LSIAGIDIGTTGCKCTVYSDAGKYLHEAYREYSVFTNNGVHELDAWAVWIKVKEVIKDAAKGVEPLKAIGVTSFGEAVILIDHQDYPLLHSMLYTDPRGEEQCTRLVSVLGKRKMNKITGLNPHHMYSISKLMWISENKPEVLERTNRICLFEDYIVYMLSGIAQIDYSLASRTMAFNIVTLEWDDELLALAGICKEKMSRVVPTGSKAGMIKAVLAKELEISENTMIVSGCHDQIAAAIGTGVLAKGMAVDGTGTVECITPVFEGIPEGNDLYDGSYAIVPHVIKGYYVTYAFSFTGGALLKWYRDHIASLEADAAREKSLNPYDVFDDGVGEEPSGLLVLPHFSGAATPYMDSSSKGAIIGLSTETTSSELYRALMEGVTYEMLLNIEHLERSGIKINELRATGGGAASPLWLQMKADILNKTIVSLGAAQSGTLGCIMLAGVACGIYRNLEEAERIFVKLGDIYLPNKKMHEKYMKYYAQYKHMYAAIKSVITQ